MNSTHILYKLNPYDEKLNASLETCSSKISSRLKIEASEPDFSEKSLQKIDEALDVTDEVNEVVSDILIELIAYSCEVHTRVYKTKWCMTLDSDGETWVPLLKNPDNSENIAWLWIYDSLHPEIASQARNNKPIKIPMRIKARKILKPVVKNFVFSKPMFLGRC